MFKSCVLGRNQFIPVVGLFSWWMFTASGITGRPQIRNHSWFIPGGGLVRSIRKQNVLTPYRENRQSHDPSKIHLKCRPPPNTLLLPIKVVRSPQRAKPMREVWYQLCSYLAELVLEVILGDHFLYTVIGFCVLASNYDVWTVSLLISTNYDEFTYYRKEQSGRSLRLIIRLRVNVYLQIENSWYF